MASGAVGCHLAVSVAGRSWWTRKHAARSARELNEYHAAKAATETQLGKAPDMMDWEKQGGSAFPSRLVHNDTPLHAETGMSLRDYFAGQALSAGVSTEDQRLWVNTWFRASRCWRYCCRDCSRAMVYEIADAMLARRSTKPLG